MGLAGQCGKRVDARHATQHQGDYAGGKQRTHAGGGQAGPASVRGLMSDDDHHEIGVSSEAVGGTL